MIKRNLYKGYKVNFFWLAILLCFTVSLVACSKKNKQNGERPNFSSERNLPDSIFPREKFAQIISDILIAESAVVQQYDPKESKLVRFEKYRYNIYKKHNIDSNYFNKNYNYYLKMPKRAELFLFVVEDTLQARKDSLRLE
ncbi:DUF4296 domain-containing protein [Bernardetia sp.]|uniref:DUF4296 domain-containing protein n=1 Tax=Bernardetia sp. TaxID=1937974 RepID=UPI0025B8236A|nr:DUF4296 domain-containing protein [Bernardetia sp.]